MSHWEYLARVLESGMEAALLYVIESEGSSPGRQGFSIVVNSMGEMFGSIGGGFMEQKLVELALSKMKGADKSPFSKRQIHRKDASANQSGMICSGEQTVAFYFLDAKDVGWVSQLNEDLAGEAVGILELTNHGISYTSSTVMENQFTLLSESETEWIYREQIGHKNTMYIIGGGHVGLALSETMVRLGFYVELLDDREGLNTMKANPFAHKKTVIAYDKIDEYILEGEDSYVALVSFGYRTDKIILKKLLSKQYRYIGMMGSEEKVKTLFDELKEEGFSNDVLKKVNAPIGIPIHSKTPQEIAVSVAAEIIAIKNKPK